jgi:hypothetical protein
VLKVGDFQALARRADQDGHLRQQLLYVLKLSRDKWEEVGASKASCQGPGRPPAPSAALQGPAGAGGAPVHC